MFAKESIAKGVKFGPYVGKRVPASHVDDDSNTSYMWEVCHQDLKMCQSAFPSCSTIGQKTTRYIYMYHHCFVTSLS